MVTSETRPRWSEELAENEVEELQGRAEWVCLAVRRGWHNERYLDFDDVPAWVPVVVESVLREVGEDWFTLDELYDCAYYLANEKFDRFPWLLDAPNVDTAYSDIKGLYWTLSSPARSQRVFELIQESDMGSLITLFNHAIGEERERVYHALVRELVSLIRDERRDK